KGKDEKIEGGIENNGESAKNHELQKNMAACRGDELWNEGKEEKSRLGIEDFGENPLTKCACRRWLRCGDGRLGISRANHADAKPNEITGACLSHSVKSNGRSGKDAGDPARGREGVDESGATG